MLQYFSVTGNTVFICLSLVQPGKDGPLPILMYGCLIRARPPLGDKAYTRTHTSSENSKYINLQLQSTVCISLLVMYENT